MPANKDAELTGSSPKLLALEEAETGAVLVLSDGSRVPIDIKPSRLAEAFVENSARSLDALLANQSLEVFVGLFRTKQEDWMRIRHLVHESSKAREILGRHPTVWDSFEETFDQIRGKAHRVYCGLNQAIYTSHPFDFIHDRNRPVPWQRALLSAPGGRLFEVWVNLHTGKVEVDANLSEGHFLE